MTTKLHKHILVLVGIYFSSDFKQLVVYDFFPNFDVRSEKSIIIYLANIVRGSTYFGLFLSSFAFIYLAGLRGSVISIHILKNSTKKKKKNFVAMDEHSVHKPLLNGSVDAVHYKQTPLYVSALKWVLKILMWVIFVAWVALIFLYPSEFGSELTQKFTRATSGTIFGITGWKIQTTFFLLFIT